MTVTSQLLITKTCNGRWRDISTKGIDYKQQCLDDNPWRTGWLIASDDCINPPKISIASKYTLLQPQINYYVTKLTLQAEAWKPLESHTQDLVTFPFTCMLAVPELVGRLGECVAQQTVWWGKLWNAASPQSPRPRTTHVCCAHGFFFWQRVFSHLFPAFPKPNP